MHCYSGSLEMAKLYMEKGYMFGIGGVLTFKNSKLKDVVKEIPLQNLILETDSPYLAPERNRGKQNSPLNLIYIAEKVADIKGILFSFFTDNKRRRISSSMNALCCKLSSISNVFIRPPF